MVMPDMKKRGLGRGLDALMPGSSSSGVARPRLPGEEPSRAELIAKRTFFQAGIEDVYPSPEQPRRRFDETKLTELADTMKVHGVIVPLIVRPRQSGGYFLIAGERRWRAAQRAGLHE